jgi:hypothetical protein
MLLKLPRRKSKKLVARLPSSSFQIGSFWFWPAFGGLFQCVVEGWGFSIPLESALPQTHLGEIFLLQPLDFFDRQPRDLLDYLDRDALPEQTNDH